MPVTFSRSMRALEADSPRRIFWALTLGTLLLAVLVGWACLARIQVYEVTGQARLEVERQVHPVAASVAGRVTASYLELGRVVQIGDALVELDDEPQRLRLAEEQSQVTRLRRQMEALSEEMRTTQDAWPQENKAAQAAVEEARSRHQEAMAASRFAAGDAARQKELAASGVTSKADLQRAQAESEQKSAAATAQSLTVQRLESEAQAKEKTHQARLAKLRSELVSLEGEIATRAETVRRCEYDQQQRRILAPVAGHLAEIASLRPGAFVENGDRIGAVLPPGELKAVAQFSPLSALGRIRPGQTARLRLEGFNWTQFGSVAATVTGVANEARDGLVRVEFAVDGSSAPRIPLQHGLPGSIEAMIERVAPATLLLRTVGKKLASISRNP